MFTLKTIVMTVLGTVLMITACSDIESPTATVNSAEEIISGGANSSSGKNPIISDPIDDQMPMPMISLTGTVHFLPTPDGCIYLQPEIGEFPHELDFKFCTGSTKSLKENIAVKVTGRFNPNSYSNCVGGSVFQVHELVFLRFDPDQDNEDSERYRQSGRTRGGDDPMGCCLTYTGMYRVSKTGCIYLEWVDGKSVKNEKSVLELTFQEDCDTLAQLTDGNWIEITGNYRLLEKSPCGLGPLFNVIIFEVVNDSRYTEDNADKLFSE